MCGQVFTEIKMFHDILELFHELVICCLCALSDTHFRFITNLWSHQPLSFGFTPSRNGEIQTVVILCLNWIRAKGWFFSGLWRTFKRPLAFQYDTTTPCCFSRWRFISFNGGYTVIEAPRVHFFHWNYQNKQLFSNVNFNELGMIHKQPENHSPAALYLHFKFTHFC